jgi:site-specific recombinase XerD
VGRFLEDHGLPTAADDIGTGEMRAFMIELQRAPRFQNHPKRPKLDSPLSSHALNSYLRSIRGTWNRWRAEGMVEHSPFENVKLPRVEKKVVRTFSEAELQAILKGIDAKTFSAMQRWTT